MLGVVKKRKVVDEAGNAYLWAIKQDNVHLVALTLEQSNVDVNYLDESGYGALFYSLDSENVDVLQFLLRHKDINVNIRYKRMDVPIMWCQTADQVKLFLAHKDIRLHVLDENYHTILYPHVCVDHYDICKLLLDANVKLQTRYEKSAFEMAIINNRLEIFKLLLPYVKDCATALSTIVTCQRIEMCRLLLTRKDLEIETSLLAWCINQENYLMFEMILKHRNANPMGLLLLCVEKGRQKMFELLLAHPKVNVNGADRYTDTPLHLAIVRNATKMAVSLLEHPDLDINRVDNCGRTALVSALEQNSDSVIIDCILSRSDVNIWTKSTFTKNAWDYAVMNQDIKVCKKLRKLGWSSMTKHSTVHTSVFKEPFNETFVRFLLGCKININSKQYGMTMLMRANVALTKLLVTHKDIDLDHVMDYKMTDEKKRVLVQHGGFRPGLEKLLPIWSVRTAKYFPKDFKKVAFQWLCVANRLNLCKDMRNLILKYFAEIYKK